MSVTLTDDSKTDIVNQDVQLGATIRELLSRGGSVYFRDPADGGEIMKVILTSGPFTDPDELDKATARAGR